MWSYCINAKAALRRGTEPQCPDIAGKLIPVRSRQRHIGPDGAKREKNTPRMIARASGYAGLHQVNPQCQDGPTAIPREMTHTPSTISTSQLSEAGRSAWLTRPGGNEGQSEGKPQERHASGGLSYKLRDNNESCPII